MFYSKRCGMEIKAGSYKKYERNFKLTESHIRKIHSVMKSYSEKLDEPSDVVIQIMREDDSFYETLDIETILIDENTEGKSIKNLSLEIVSKSEDKDNKESKRSKGKALLEFDLNEHSTIKVVTAHSSRDWCFLLVDELDTQIQRVIQGNSRPFYSHKLLDLIFSIGVFISCLGWFAWSKQKTAIDVDELLLKSSEEKINYLVTVTADVSNGESLYLLPAMLAGVLVIVFFMEFKPLNKLITLSNLSVFHWGDMISTHDKIIQKRIRIKWSIIVAFSVSLAASFVGAWLI